MDNLIVRPNLATGKKTVGSLETYANGMRFTSRDGQRVDINFSNVKHAFFQPCENEMIILIHFHLKKPNIVGNKKVSDIQFYQECGNLVDDLDNKKRKFNNEYDEIEQEKREMEMRIRLNQKFKKFVETVAVVAKRNKFDLDFDIPFTELAFTGAPDKSLLNLMPTGSCLVNLTEYPPFVITMEDVEIVHFERVHFQIKNFDMVFLNKDFSTFKRICSIPSELLESIKQWLDSVDILFSEGQSALVWPNILAEIKSNFQNFLDEGCWSFLRDDGEEGEESASNDSSFNQSVSASESDAGSSESSFSGDKEDSSEDDNEPSDSESAANWEEMDRKAAEQDKKSFARQQAQGRQR